VPREKITTYLALAVGRFRLALNGDRVLAILADVPCRDSLMVRNETVAFVDLQAWFVGRPRTTAPFAVAFEVGGGRAAVGVDRVDHIRLQTATTPRPVPRFGLKTPLLFAGALRDPTGLLLVLDPEVLGALTAAKKFAI
jgi:hypothetical protein